VLAAERDDSELVCGSLRYVEPVQLGVQQLRQAPVELVDNDNDYSLCEWVSEITARNLVHRPQHLPAQDLRNEDDHSALSAIDCDGVYSWTGKLKTFKLYICAVSVCAAWIGNEAICSVQILFS